MAAEDWATYNTNARAKAAESAEIARQIAEFEQRGGKVKTIGPGVLAGKEKSMLESASLVPEETRKRATERSKQSKLANKNMVRHGRVTPKMVSILKAIIDLSARGEKVTRPNICKVAGTKTSDLGPTMDGLILKGLVEDTGRKEYRITEMGVRCANA